MRTTRDCTELAAAVITSDRQTHLALLFGLLCGAYINHPEARFWDVIDRFVQNRFQAEALIKLS